MRISFNIAILTVLAGCVENPVTVDQETPPLLFTSFESSGLPSLEDWYTSRSTMDTNAILFNEGSPGGGSWSARVFGVPLSTQAIFRDVKLNQSDSLTKYIISFWAKGNGAATIQLSSSATKMLQFGPIRSFDEPNWTHFSDTLVSHSTQFDTLSVLLSRGIFDSIAVAQFDEVLVIRNLP